MRIYKLSELAATISAQKLKANSCVAFVFCEDNSLIDETVKFLQKRDFDLILLFVNEPSQVRKANRVINIKFKYFTQSDIWNTINQALPALRGHWLYYGSNGEFFYYPFCESRSVHDLADFMVGERRLNIAGTVIDLYTGDIVKHSNGMSMTNVYFDRSNYYSKPSYFKDIDIDPGEYDRIRFIFGGMRWRLAEHLPYENQRIDRVPFFYVDDELSFNAEGLTERPEFYTMRCAFHHNTTCAVMSFQMARYFRLNHDMRQHVADFMWEGSQRFRWNSAQLLRLGIIETGQWF